MRKRGPWSLSAVTGALLVVAAALMLLLRLPGAFSAFDSGAKAAQGRNELGGALATADAVGLNDDFVRYAFHFVPVKARFAVVLPADEASFEQKGTNPVTFAALPTFFENYLLPRREVATATRGTYILCYLCRSPYWDRRTKWLANDNAGGLVGYVTR